MQLKKSKHGKRGPNAEEKRWTRYTKLCDCIVCGAPGPSIVDHCLGSRWAHNGLTLGHKFIIPLCYSCDKFKSTPAGNIPRFIEMAGQKLFELWEKHVNGSPYEFLQNEYDAIVEWGR